MEVDDTPPADWETADGDVDPLLTPDDPEGDEGDDVVNEAIIKPKKKLIQAEETKSKREHVNVVFIGHVGKNVVFVFVCVIFVPFTSFVFQLPYLTLTYCHDYRCWKINNWWSNHVSNRNGRQENTRKI